MRDVDFDIPEGRITRLIGSDGAGSNRMLTNAPNLLLDVRKGGVTIQMVEQNARRN